MHVDFFAIKFFPDAFYLFIEVAAEIYDFLSRGKDHFGFFVGFDVHLVKPGGLEFIMRAKEGVLPF